MRIKKQNDTTITSLTHIAIVILMFQIINSIRMRNNTRTGAINLVDASTYYIYPIHYPLMVGPLSIVGKCYICTGGGDKKA